VPIDRNAAIGVMFSQEFQHRP